MFGKSGAIEKYLWWLHAQNTFSLIFSQSTTMQTPRCSVFLQLIISHRWHARRTITRYLVLFRLDKIFFVLDIFYVARERRGFFAQRNSMHQFCNVRLRYTRQTSRISCRPHKSCKTVHANHLQHKYTQSLYVFKSDDKCRLVRVYWPPVPCLWFALTSFLARISIVSVNLEPTKSNFTSRETTTTFYNIISVIVVPLFPTKRRDTHTRTRETDVTPYTYGKSVCMLYAIRC